MNQDTITGITEKTRTNIKKADLWHTKVYKGKTLHPPTY